MSQQNQNRGKEFEISIFGITTGDPQNFLHRVHAFCDDACLHAPVVHVMEEVYQRKGASSTISAASSAIQEMLIRTIEGDIIDSRFVCAAGVSHTPKYILSSSKRMEAIAYSKYPFEFLKVIPKSPDQSNVCTRTMNRSNVNGDIQGILDDMGFYKKHQVCFTGSRYLTRSNIEIMIFRLVDDFKSQNYIIPTKYERVEDSPMLVSLKTVAFKDEDQVKFAKHLREFATLLFASTDIVEVRQDTLYQTVRR